MSYSPVKSDTFLKILFLWQILNLNPFHTVFHFYNFWKHQKTYFYYSYRPKARKKNFISQFLKFYNQQISYFIHDKKAEWKIANLKHFS